MTLMHHKLGVACDDPDRPGGLELVWRITGRGLADAGMLADRSNGALATALRRHDAGELLWRIDGRGARATLRIGQTLRDLAEVDAERIVEVRTGGVHHIDAGALLSVTFLWREGMPTVLYARTDIFERVLGVGGGVYDVPTARVPASVS